jgi:TonB-linked SusC/RagA family outer membrane protein
MLCIGTLEAQQAPASTARRARVTGRITDAASGEPLVGASVQVVGTGVTTLSNGDGRYVIASAPTGIWSLEARRIGFGNKVVANVRLTSDSVITVNFALSTNPLRLTEMVVSATVDPTSGLKTPYTVDKLTAANLPVAPLTSAAGAIIGKVAGATVIAASGAPGSGVNIQLRSPVSQFNSNGPLFLVDGVFLNSTQAVTTQDIESMDIATIEVIKGAAAASLYGTRAASGVISITTNRGQGLAFGQTQITVRNEYGQNNVASNLVKPTSHQFRVNDAGQYVDATGVVVARNQRVLQANGISENTYIDPLFNHIDQFFEAGGFNTQTLTVQQNSATTNFNLSYTRNQQPGVIEASNGYSRQSLRANIDVRIKEKLQLGASLFHQRASEDPSSVSFLDLYRINPDVDLRAPELLGTSRFRIIPDSTELRTNPFYRQTFNDNITNRMRSLISLNSSYRPASWLTFDALASYDRGDRQVTNYIARGLTNLNGDGTTIGSLEINDFDVDGINAQGGASLLKGFGGLTTRLAMRGEIQREQNPSIQTLGTDFTLSGVKNMNAARTKQVVSSLTDQRVRAGFANLGLDYSGKYIADVLVRREGSSLFGPEGRWNTFYRASAAWLLSEEGWWNVPGLNLFKLRYNVGTAGTRPGFADQYSALGIDATGAISRTGLGNPALRPELAREQEFGVDMIVKNRVQLSVVQVFSRSTGNLISIPAPAITGFNTNERNVGGIAGRTIEGTLQAQILNNPKGLQWDVLVTADQRRNRITDFGRTCFGDGILWRCDNTRLGTMWGNRHVRDRGQLLPVHANSQAVFDVNSDGYLVAVGAGNTALEGKAKNLWGTTVNVDGRNYAWGRPIFEIDSATGQRWFGQIGDGQPAMQFGFGNTFRYKGFRLYGLLNGQMGGDIYNQVRQSLYASNDHIDVDQREKPDELRKPTSYYATGLADGNNNFGAPFVEDGTYARLSEFTVGYNLDAKKIRILRTIGADRIQLDLVGRNLFTLTRYSGLNPESGSPNTRVDNTVYPLLRTFSLATTIIF